jgi:hypothetical protein
MEEMNQEHAYNLSAVREVIESLVYGNTNLHGRKKNPAAETLGPIYIPRGGGGVSEKVIKSKGYSRKDNAETHATLCTSHIMTKNKTQRAYMMQVIPETRRAH